MNYKEWDNRSATQKRADGLRHDFIDPEAREHPWLSNQWMIKNYKNGIPKGSEGGGRTP